MGLGLPLAFSEDSGSNVLNLSKKFTRYIIPRQKSMPPIEKIKIDNNAFIHPMPMTIVGSVVHGKSNFMALGWISRVNVKPPMIAIALGPHHTNKGIEEHKVFSVNIPGIPLIEKTD
jgi:flavin reductase (DIM6/NTAB) family NADH-FMN oxidoreductase RutF